jgi:hypothetical protein
MPQRRIGSAPSSAQARPRTAGKNSRRRASTGDAASEQTQKKQSGGSLGPRVSKRGHMVADSWSRQAAGSRRRSWMLEDRPDPDIASVIEKWRSADSKRRQPTKAQLQKLPSSAQARKVLAGELSPRTALPFLHAVKDRLAEEKEQQRIYREHRAEQLRHTLQVGVRVASLASDLEQRRALAAAKAEQVRVDAEAEERRRRRDIKVAERRRVERQRLRMRGIYTYDEAGVAVM